MPFAAPAEVILRLDPGPLAGRGPARVPRELPPAAERFFGREAERVQLSERLRAGLNTAVVGPSGLGKTAPAARALADVVGANAAGLAASPFPDGLVSLDLYTLHGQAEPAWNALANLRGGPEFLERRPARERATEACRARRVLIIVEGGEEADGSAGRTSIRELLSVLSPENRWLLLTRLGTQAAVAETVDLREAYRESLAVSRRLAEADPSNAGWQRDLSFSLTRLAEFHEQQADRTAALPLAEASLSIDERLAELDRTNVTWQRDVAVSRALVARLRAGGQ